MNMWEGLVTAPVFETGAYLNPGSYDVEIQSVFVKQTQKVGAGFIVELTPLTSTKRVEPEYYNVEPSAVGTAAGWFVKLANMNTAMPNIKQFLMGIFGVDHQSPEGAQFSAMLPMLMGRATNAENLLGGIRAHLETTHKIIASGPNAGKPFTRHNWFPYQVNLGDGYRVLTYQELLARPVPQYAPQQPQAPWGVPATPPGWGAPSQQPQAPWGPQSVPAPGPHFGPPGWGAPGAPTYVAPPPPPAPSAVPYGIPHPDGVHVTDGRGGWVRR